MLQNSRNYYNDGQRDGHYQHRTKQRFYYNVSIPHDDKVSVAGSPTPAKFSEVRDEPLLKGSPKNYNMSVIRFTIPTSYIPIQFFPVQYDTLNPTNPNKSIYSITLSYDGNDFQQFLEWETQDNGVSVPPPPSAGVDIRNYQYNPEYLEYYSLYSFNHFCELINNALDVCYQTNIVPLLPAPTPPNLYKSPFITFDGKTNLFTIHTPATFLDTNPLPVELYFNTFLNENFDTSYDTTFNAYTAPDGKNVKYNIVDFGGTNFQIDADEESGGFYILGQEFDTTGQMTSFTSLIIRSNSLPIVNEALSLQPRPDSIQGTGIGGGSESIISDFEIDIGSSGTRNLRAFIHYIPTAEYRRITLQGDSPIYRIDVEILWKDNYDNLYPVLIPPHDIATIKILFEEN
jgi:hypothetical protein